MTDYSRQPRKCHVCGNTDYAPEVMPYLGKAGHVWMHPLCCRLVYEAHRKPIPEMEFPNAGGLGEGER